MTCKCLIADDEEMIAQSTCEYFNMFDLCSFYVTSHEECVAFFSENQAELLLLDIGLGERSGFPVRSIFLIVSWNSTERSEPGSIAAFSTPGELCDIVVFVYAACSFSFVRQVSFPEVKQAATNIIIGTDRKATVFFIHIPFYHIFPSHRLCPGGRFRHSLATGNILSVIQPMYSAYMISIILNLFKFLQIKRIRIYCN